MEAADLSARDALGLTLKWAEQGNGPDEEKVLTVSGAAFPLIWKAWPNDDSLVILGELRRYALSREPEPDNECVWRDELIQDGLGDFFYASNGDESDHEGFAFHFAGYGMKEKFIDMVQANVWSTSDQSPKSPAPALQERPPECVAAVHREIESFYAVLSGCVKNDAFNATVLQAMATTCDGIYSAAQELATLLAMAHEPYRVGFFIQAIHDTFEPFQVGQNEGDYSWDELGVFRNIPDRYYDEIWDWRELRRVGIPYFRKAAYLMTKCWPYVDPEDAVYAPARLASALTGLTLVELNRLSQPGGPIRCKKPSANRRLIHLGDLARYMEDENPHL